MTNAEKRPGSNANSPLPSEPLEAPLVHPYNTDGKKRPKRFKKAATLPETRSMLPEGLLVQKTAEVPQVDGAAQCSDSEGSTNPLPKLVEKEDCITVKEMFNKKELEKSPVTKPLPKPDEKEDCIKTVKEMFNRKGLEESPSAGIVQLASKMAAQFSYDASFTSGYTFKNTKGSEETRHISSIHDDPRFTSGHTFKNTKRSEEPRHISAINDDPISKQYSVSGRPIQYFPGGFIPSEKNSPWLEMGPKGKIRRSRSPSLSSDDELYLLENQQLD